METTKESLIDWTVTENGKRVATISKDFEIKGGYNVKFTGLDGKYLVIGFAAAKKFISGNK